VRFILGEQQALLRNLSKLVERRRHSLVMLKAKNGEVDAQLLQSVEALERLHRLEGPSESFAMLKQLDSFLVSEQSCAAPKLSIVEVLLYLRQHGRHLTASAP